MALAASGNLHTQPSCVTSGRKDLWEESTGIDRDPLQTGRNLCRRARHAVAWPFYPRPTTRSSFSSWRAQRVLAGVLVSAICRTLPFQIAPTIYRRFAEKVSYPALLPATSWPHSPFSN